MPKRREQINPARHGSVFRMSRRTLIGALAALPIPALLRTTSALAQDASRLASWNDGPAKRSIIDFVQGTNDSSSPKFVPREERIATFDQDGTLWVEQHPMYTQVIYCLDRVPAVVSAKPDLKNRGPFKTVLSGDREAIAKRPLRDLEEILVATLTGMPVEVFESRSKEMD
jgi:hypothetical protein